MSKTSRVLQPHQTALLLALVISIVAFLAPAIHAVFLPLVYLNTHLHELCHAIAAVITGGEVQGISVFADGSGVTPIRGGNAFIEISAGYPGATVIGAGMILIGGTPARARAVLGALAAILAVSMILWVREDLVGVISGLAWSAALGAGACFLRGGSSLFVCQLVGIQQCVNAVTIIFQLMRISMVTDRANDALTMQSFTYVPAVAWASMWCVFSLLMVALAVRKAWQVLDPKAGAAAGRAGGL